MHEVIKPVDNVKMLTLVSLLSKYDLFHISVSDGQEFNATEIINSDFGGLEFNRCFATSVYSNDIIVGISAVKDNEFICKTPSKTYTIKALHTVNIKDFPRKEKKWDNIFDLLDIHCRQLKRDCRNAQKEKIKFVQKAN